MSQSPALVCGPTEPTLCFKTLGTVVDEQANSFKDRTAIVVPWQSTSLSYRELAERSKVVAMALLQIGLRHGDCVGIVAGNCYQYIEVFLGGARIGCPVVVFNNTYTPEELSNATRLSSCKVVFLASKIGPRSLASHIKALCGADYPDAKLPELQLVVCFGGDKLDGSRVETQLYTDFTSNGVSARNNAWLKRAEDAVQPSDVLNLQFTSGTTSAPKAAMLTHINIINNGRFVGNAMQLIPDDVVCCPPPLFHCFGLVLGFLSSLSHGCAIVFPSDHFNAENTVDAIFSTEATVLLGVPTMFVAELEAIAKKGKKPRQLRVGLAAGAPLSPALINKVQEQMGLEIILNAYGMTETSPITFMTAMDDGDERRKTLGRVMPHITAKVIDTKGNTLPRGQRGELCTSGYALQKSYWRNEEKTREVMKRDANGVLWMHTGDEVVIDEEGYAQITGRIKDIIIRGGENIFPREIEERLISHPSISDVSVVGLKDEKFGEVVASFLQKSAGCSKPSDEELRIFVGEKLGRHKTPQYVFWIGDPGVGDAFPKTGSGKHQKHIMQKIGNRLVGKVEARL